MTLRQIAKAVLSVPQLRRLYDHAGQLRAEITRLEQENSRLGGLEQSARAALAKAKGEQEQLSREQEDLEIQLYVLRSDFNRAVGQAEELRLCAKDAEGALEALRAENEALRNERDILRRSPSGDGPNALARHLEQFRARVLSGLTLMSGDINSVCQMLHASGSGVDQALTELRIRYLDLLENALTGKIYCDTPMSPWSRRYDPDVRTMGRDWPAQAQTMIGSARMRNLRHLIETVIDQSIEGDLLEAGVWRGGACIYMRGILAAHGSLDRKVWVADSFQGLPPPDAEKYPADAGDAHHTVQELAISLDQVRANFENYSLLDGQVEFLPGWFKDTLPTLPARKLAILRLDGDMYQSTIEALNAAYAKVSPGGFVIIDDYILPACRQAVEDFRGANDIDDGLQEIDGAAVYWRKSA